VSVLGSEEMAMEWARAVCVPLAKRSLSEMSEASSSGWWRILTCVLML
jgi:hypothetical protein